ncbi:MAG: hypothetical protein KJ915_05505 [Candidatus Omnitrophica bacterium]|nr:hypothetical protein [Candidatus Omnitrophota bacterium]
MDIKKNTLKERKGGILRKYINCLIFGLIIGLFNFNAFAFELASEFVDSEYGYSIKYPLDWYSKINRSGMVLADINTKDNKSGLQIRVTQSNQSIDDYVLRYIDKFKQDMQAQLTNQEYMLIDNKKAYKISFQANRRGKDYLLLSYIMADDQTARVFIFQAGVLYDQRYEIIPVLDAIAGSFELK